MKVIGVGKRVRIYFGESDQWQGRPLFLAILEKLRSEGAAGATVFRGIAGFGAHSRIHTATLVRLSEDLPIVVEWVDTAERVDRLLPSIAAMVDEGMITVDETQLAHYHQREVDEISRRARVRDAMTRDVVSVHPELPLAEAVELLVGRDYRALPVVDARGRVVGIVTSGDLVERGGLRMRVDLLGALTAEQLAHELALIEAGKAVGDVMTSPVVTIGPDATLADAAHLMVTRRLKRLPVAGASERLLGIISRADLLRTRAEAAPPFQAETPPHLGHTIGDVMRTDIPVVPCDAPLSAVLDAVISTRLDRALVVDSARRVAGVVTDAELLRRLSPEDHPSVLKVLMSRLPFVRLSPPDRRSLQHALGTTAGQLMDATISAVPPDMPLGPAIEIMIRERRKLLPVVDTTGRLLGAADRADLLRTLVALEHQAGGP